MTSNLYLFDPQKIQSNAGEKPLIQLVREAEVARAEETARMLKNGFARLRRLFGSKKPEVVAKAAKAPAEEHRLAA